MKCNMKRLLVTLGSALTVASMITGCAGAGPASSGGDKMNIGIIAPLTGAVSVYGVAASNGAKLGFDEINKAGGISGKQVNYIAYDDKGDSTESVNAYNKLASNDKVVAIVGAVTSGPTSTMASAAQKDGMPIITPTATAEAVTTYGDNIFRACFLDAYQSQAMATFAAQNLSATKAAILYNSSDDYSAGLADNFKQRFEQLGGTIVSFEAYISDDKDYKTQLTNIKAAAPDVLFLPDYYNTVALISKQVKEVGITATLLGADGWDGVFTAIEDKSLVEGACYASHYSVDDPSAVVQDFITNFKTAYNSEPNSFAALGYDAAKIMAAAIQKAGSTDKKAIVDAIKATDFTGVTGAIKFDANGNPIKEIAIIKIEGGQTKLLTKIQP